MRLLKLSVVVVAALIALPALAQDKPADTMQIVREKLQADKKLLVATNMGLTEKEAQAFWPVYDSFQKDLGLLNGRMLVLIQDFAKTYQAMSDDAAKKLVGEYLAIERDRVKLKQAYLPKLRQALPEKKVARYLQIENKIEAVIREKSAGWEIGSGPSVVIVDEGVAKALTTTTTGRSDVYAFFFDQRGLMGGLGLQGSKMTKIEK